MLAARALEAVARPRVVTLDGPSASGKSTLGTALAAELDWTFLDSGLAYRALAVLAMDRGLASDESTRLSRLASELHLQLGWGGLKVRGAPPDLLGACGVAEIASQIATAPAVRAVLTRRLQDLIAGRACVVAGRDAASSICAEAPLQVFLTASSAVRAKRRELQVGDRSPDIDLDFEHRDQRDRTRAEAPLRPAPGAILLDTSAQAPDESLDVLRLLVKARIDC